MTRELMIKAIYEKIADKTWSLGCKFLIKGEPNSTKDKMAYEIIYCQPRGSSTLRVINGEVQRGGMHTSDMKSSEFCYKFYKGVYYIDFTKIKENEFFEKVYTIGHPVMINRIEYVLPKNDYLEIRQSISKEELLLPIDDWNIEAINLLYKKVGF